MKLKFFFILVLGFCYSVFPQTNGNLLIIGGGKIPDYITKKFIDLTGSEKSKILVIPLASSVPQKSFTSFKDQLNRNGAFNVISFITNKNEIDNDSNIVKLKDVKGIFFTGGDQNKLTELFNGSKILELVKSIYKKGGVIGGTSAGAAIMSSIMITGNELINTNTKAPFNSITKGNIESTNGFGFLNNIIIDQHFIKRKRLNRLMSLVLENNKSIGIGIDESTGIIVNSSNVMEVIGESLVTIIDARAIGAVTTNINKNLSAKDIKVHLLKSGDKFNLLK